MSRCSVEVAGRTYALLLLCYDCGLRLDRLCGQHGLRGYCRRLSWRLFNGMSRLLCLCSRNTGCPRRNVELFVGPLTGKDGVDLQNLLNYLFRSLSVAAFLSV